MKAGSATVHKIDNRADYLDVSAQFGRFIAAWVVRRIRLTRIHVLQVTALAFVAGALAAAFVVVGDPVALLFAGLLVQIKNILDTVDGSLARARHSPSAIGRYADSICDFLTNALLFWAMAVYLSDLWGSVPAHALAFAAFLSQLFQCSYYVFYVRRYLNQPEPEGPLDWRHPAWTEFLRNLYGVVYGWQDRLVAWIDQAGIARAQNLHGSRDWNRVWYRNRRLLFLNSFLGLGTQLFLMTVFLWMGRPGLYLLTMAVGGNLFLGFLIWYRTVIVKT